MGGLHARKPVKLRRKRSFRYRRVFEVWQVKWSNGHLVHPFGLDDKLIGRNTRVFMRPLSADANILHCPSLFEFLASEWSSLRQWPA